MNLTRKNVTILLSVDVSYPCHCFQLVFFRYSGYLSSPKDRPKGGCANYDQEKNVITVTCNSTLSEVHNIISDDNLLKKETSEGIWFLNSSVVVSKEAVLTINNKDGKWIKINSENSSGGNEGSKWSRPLFYPDFWQT